MGELEDRSMYSIDIQLWPKKTSVDNTLESFDRYFKQYQIELKNLKINLSHYTVCANNDVGSIR